MKFQTIQKKTIGLKFRFVTIFFLILFACATTPVKTYDETVSEWKSYKDVAKWMDMNFSYDMKMLKESFGKYSNDNPIPVRPPQEIFKLKTGLCFDAARFAEETLNCIDASYQAEIVFFEYQDSPLPRSHCVCSFRKDGKLYIMDYGIPVKSVVGVHGPYNSLEEYKKFYEPRHRTIKSFSSELPPFTRKVVE